MSAPFAVVHRMPTDRTAVRAWLDAGATRFECDVQLAGDPADGRVVVSHFLPFLRLRGWFQHDGMHFRWGDGRWGDGRGGDPTLEDALTLLPGRANVLLDPKETDPSRRAQLVRALDRVVPGGPARGVRFAVSTDHEHDLDGYRSAGFTTWRTVKDAASLHTFLGARATAHDGVSIRHSLLERRTVDRLHEVVPTVVAWTVADLQRAADLIGWGVEGVTTDCPTVATAVTRAGRGRSPGADRPERG